MLKSIDMSKTLIAGAALIGATLLIAGDGNDGKLMHPGVDGVKAPKVKEIVSPVYPAEAEGAAGTVTAAVMVLADGSVGEVAIVDASVRGAGFERAVVEAVERWRYKPARHKGRNVDSYTFVKLDFAAPDPLLPSGSRLAPMPNWMGRTNLFSDSLAAVRMPTYRGGTKARGTGNAPTGAWNLSRAPNRVGVNSSWQRYQAGLSVNPKPNQPDARRGK